MKFLLAAVNAKYIHSNLGIYSLNKYAQEKLETRRAQGEACPGIQIEMGEYTINQQMDLVLQDIYRRSPDVLYLEYSLCKGTCKGFEKGDAAAYHMARRTGGVI
jgi:hypothetical protein